MNEIFGLIQCYLKLKDDYKEYNKENLFKVFNIFENEVYELNDIVNIIDEKIDKRCLLGYELEKSSIEVILEEEENLVNEIADVILTTARLIKEFKLEEPLAEMMEYKYHRQLVRELKRFKNVKNELLK